MHVTPIGFSNYIWWSRLWAAPEYAMAKCALQLGQLVCIHEMHSVIPVWFGVHVVHWNCSHCIRDNRNYRPFRRYARLCSPTSPHGARNVCTAHFGHRMNGACSTCSLCQIADIVRMLENHINRGVFPPYGMRCGTSVQGIALKCPILECEFLIRSLNGRTVASIYVYIAHALNEHKANTCSVMMIEWPKYGLSTDARSDRSA